MADSRYSASPDGRNPLFTPETAFEPCFTHILGSSPSISITPGYGCGHEDEFNTIGHSHNVKAEVPGLLGVNNFTTIHSRNSSNQYNPSLDYPASHTPSVASQCSEDMGDTPTRFLIVGHLPKVSPHKVFAFFQVRSNSLAGAVFFILTTF
jgi:hypothetical protein